MGNRRTVRKEILLSAEEYARIRHRAEACGVLPAVYIRETALGAVPKARPNRLPQEVIYRLGRIGAALNCVAQAPDDAHPSSGSVDIRALREEIAGLILSIGDSLSRNGDRMPPGDDDREGHPGP